MYAVKQNREYAVNNDVEKAAFIKDGFDIVDDKGKLITAGRGKTVSYEQYEKLKAENESLKAENESLKAEIEKLSKKK